MNIEPIIKSIVEAFRNVKGIEGIVLGGSRATKTENEFSDIDIGIYYNENFDISTFRKIAIKLDDEHRENCITNIGEWGPWINGGGWLKINNVPVDILLRDIKKVTQCIDNCKKGVITIDYQSGHPFGFINSIYMGEVFYCEILHANSNRIQELKNSLKVFPSTYKTAAIQRFLWECEFSIQCGKKAIKKNDILYASGSIFRSVICLIYVLYAENEMYCLNEKGSLDRLIKSDNVRIPMGFKETIEKSMSINKNNISIVFDEIHKLYVMVQDMVFK